MALAQASRAAPMRLPTAESGHGGGWSSTGRPWRAARCHALKMASSARPTSVANAAPTSIETSTAAYRPCDVSSSASARSDVVLPTCRGAWRTKYPSPSMICRTPGSRRNTGSM